MKNPPFKFMKGKWQPLWAILMIPFLVIFLPLYRFVKNEVKWKAAWATVGTFSIIMFVAEYFSISRGHWVFNESRILGPKILGIPIEEPFLYYLFSPLIIISIFHAIRVAIKKHTKLEGS